MDTILWMGTLVGVVLGCAHGVYVYRTMASGNMAAAEGDSGGLRLRAAYHAVWTALLWVLFGTYVLVFWAISVLAYGIRNLLKR
jgi:hypothetical protein